MKKIWWGLVLLGVGMWVWSRPQKLVTPLPSPTPTTSSAVGVLGLSENETVLVEIDSDYRVGWEIINPAQVRVGINLDLAESSEELQVGHNCRVLTSAAFYDTNDQPMGLLMSQTATLSAWQENQLLNGILGWQKDINELSISTDLGEYDWAVQAGPILWNQTQPITLKLASDQMARRIVAGITETKQLVLMVITAKDSLFSGPYLQDLGSVLTKWQELAGVKLTAAINLDGGTASAFLSPTFKLKELKPIGSYICVD